MKKHLSKKAIEKLSKAIRDGSERALADAKHDGISGEFVLRYLSHIGTRISDVMKKYRPDLFFTKKVKRVKKS